MTLSEIVREEREKAREADKERKRLYRIEYRKKNRERMNEYQRQYYRRPGVAERQKANVKPDAGIRHREKMRAIIYSILGDKCKRCGFSDRRALQIDHINGGGSKENKKANALRFRVNRLKANPELIAPKEEEIVAIEKGV